MWEVGAGPAEALGVRGELEEVGQGRRVPGPDSPHTPTACMGKLRAQAALCCLPAGVGGATCLQDQGSSQAWGESEHRAPRPRAACSLLCGSVLAGGTGGACPSGMLSTALVLRTHPCSWETHNDTLVAPLPEVLFAAVKDRGAMRSSQGLQPAGQDTGRAAVP